MSSNTVQRLMECAPRGQPLDSDLLRDNGVSTAMASHLVQKGWLFRLSHGAYLLKGDTPSTEGTVAYLNRRIPGLHVGGKTALACQGGRKDIEYQEIVQLWGLKPYEFPEWVVEHMPFSYQTTHLFDEFLPYEKGLKPLTNGNPSVLVSVPERALLEMASDIGIRQSLEEARILMNGLLHIRPMVLDEFLMHCKRVKVVRLVRDLAKDVGFSWASEIQKHVDRLGAGKRWSNRTKSGERLTLNPR